MDLGAVIESERGVFIENVRKTIEKRDNLKHLSTIKGMDQRVADRMRFAHQAIKQSKQSSGITLLKKTATRKLPL